MLFAPFCLTCCTKRAIGAIVSLKHVVIISPHGLFRDGLKRLLVNVAQVELAASIEKVEELARKQQVDAVIIDQEESQMRDRAIISRLLSLPGVRVITVSLEAGDMQIYQHEQVGAASVEDLVAAVLD